MVNRSKLSFLLMFLFLFSFVMVSATETDIGTKKLNDCIDLIQSCADCTYVNFSSYTAPNGTRTVGEWAGIKSGPTFTYYNCSITNQLGTWIIDGHGDVESTDTVFTYTYTVTTTGNPTPEGMPMFQMGLIIIIFGTACFFLYLSATMGETAFKIFFLLASLVFLMATMLTAYMVSLDGNVAATTNATTLSLVSVLGGVLVIVFVYILIRQTINALDMYNIKRGRAWDVGAGGKVAGYNTKRAY